MIGLTIFPNFKWRSFTLAVALIDIVFFIFLVLYDNPEIEEGLLAPSQLTLFKFGEVYPWYMRHSWHLHRFILPLFMHCNLLHLLSSVMLFIYIYSTIEKLIGIRKTVCLFFGTGIVGILLNLVMSNEPGVAGSIPLGAFLFSLCQEIYIFKTTRSDF